MPGNSPFIASSRKQILQIPNLFIKDLFLPHILHTFLDLVLYFGFLFALTVFDVFAICYFWNGIPNALSKLSPSLLSLAVVTIEISSPCIFSIPEGSISGKTVFSENPKE